MKLYVYDVESYPNIFTFVFKEVSKEKKIKVFEISSRKDDRRELISFLKEKITLIGYNNCHFDYPVLHYLLKNPNASLVQMFQNVETIFNSNFYLPEYKFLIPQIDLFKIWHYDNPARSCSLKWLEFTLRWKKVQDLPFVPGTIIPEKDFDKLIEYNINDVDFTFFFLGKSLDAIRFREQMSKKLNHRVMNYSDVKIGEYINQINYSKRSKRAYNEFKNDRTIHTIFHLKDIIPKNIEFKTDYLKTFLERLRKKSFTSGKDDDSSFDEILHIGNISIKFAKGGLHSEDTPRIVNCKEGWKLKEKDIGSMYPWTIIADEIYPAHLGPEWNKGIKQSFEHRAFVLKPKLKTLKKNSPEFNAINSEQEAYKLSMNGGGFGKLGSEYSWQCDYLAKYKVTIGGELKLLMLIEEFYLNDIDIISVNTDGVVVHYPKEKEEIVTKIHKDWEKKTTYILEDTSYKKIIFSTVNDYIAEIIDEKTEERVKIKYKGDFEFDQDPHKNNSQRIVAIALNEYFINNKPVEEIVKNIGYEFTNSKGEKEKTSIFDYCIGKKNNDKVDNYSLVNGYGIAQITDKVIRYYVSNSNDKLVKVYSSGKIEAVNKGFNHTLFMNYEKKEDYNINFDYYIQECYKLINPIKIGSNKIKKNYVESEQLKLF